MKSFVWDYSPFTSRTLCSQNTKIGENFQTGNTTHKKQLKTFRTFT